MPTEGFENDEPNDVRQENSMDSPQQWLTAGNFPDTFYEGNYSDPSYLLNRKPDIDPANAVTQRDNQSNLPIYEQQSSGSDDTMLDFQNQHRLDHIQEPPCLANIVTQSGNQENTMTYHQRSFEYSDGLAEGLYPLSAHPLTNQQPFGFVNINIQDNNQDYTMAMAFLEPLLGDEELFEIPMDWIHEILGETPSR